MEAKSIKKNKIICGSSI